MSIAFLSEAFAGFWKLSTLEVFFFAASIECLLNFGLYLVGSGLRLRLAAFLHGVSWCCCYVV